MSSSFQKNLVDFLSLSEGIGQCTISIKKVPVILAFFDILDTFVRPEKGTLGYAIQFSDETYLLF